MDNSTLSTTEPLVSIFQQKIQAACAVYGDCRFVVAYSGGLDSQVLLHLSAHTDFLRGRVRAIHVNHGIQQEAQAWQANCVAWASVLGVELTVIGLNLGGKASETRARLARQQAFGRDLKDAEVLLTAHHQDDQAETFLLRLIRRAGVVGLGGMREYAAVQGLQIFKPLLSVSKNRLRAYARDKQLAWVEDPSNACTSIDRNYVRHEVMPRLVERWPRAVETIDRVASFCQEADQLCQDLGRFDYQSMVHVCDFALVTQSALCLKQLQALAGYRAKNAVFAWLRDLGVNQFNHNDWRIIQSTLIQATEEAQPEVHVGAFVICRYQNQMIAVNKSDFLHCKQVQRIEQYWPFVLQTPNIMPELKLSISFVHEHTSIPLSRSWLADNALKLSWRMRQSGDRFRPMGKPYGMQLKKLWQEARVPYWCRDQVPMLVFREAACELIVAVFGVGVCEMAYPSDKQDAVSWKLDRLDAQV